MIFDPNDIRCLSLAATSSDVRTTINEDWEKAQAEREHALRMREFGPLMLQRHGVCG